MTLEQQQAMAMANARARAASVGSQPPSTQYPSASPSALPAPTRQMEAPDVAGTISRYGTIAARELTPATAFMATGAALGAPAAGIGMLPGAVAGLGTYGLTRLLGNPAVEITNAATGLNIPTPSQGEEALKNMIYGEASAPNTPTERIFASGIQGLADSVGGYGMGKMALNAGKSIASPMLQGVGKTLTQTPALDAGVGLVTGTSMGTVSEATDNPYAKFAIGMAAPVATATGINALKAGTNALGGSQALSSFLTGGMDAGSQQILNAADKAANLNVRTGFFNREAPAFRAAADRVGREIQAAATAGGKTTIDETIANIDSATSALNSNPQTALPAGVNPSIPLSPGFNITTGAASDNVGLGMMERGIGNSSPRMQQRNIDNMRAINRESAQATSPAAGYDDTANAAQSFVSGALRDKQIAANQGATLAQRNLRDAETGLANEQANISDRSDSLNRAEASTKIRASLTNEQKLASAAVDEKFATVPQNVTIDLSENTLKQLDNTIAAYEETLLPKPAAVDELAAILKANGNQLPSGVAQKNLQALYEFASSAPAGSQQAKALGELRSALDTDISLVEEVSIPLKQARNFYRETFVPQFKSGDSFDVLYRRGAGNAPSVNPSQTIDQYLQGGSQESAKQLNNALSFSGGKVSVKDEAALTDWVLSNLGAKSGSKPTPEKVDAFLRSNSAMLAELPQSITGKIQDIANNLTTLGKGVETATEAATQAGKRVKIADQLADKSPLAQYANPDRASTGFANAVQSQNPIQNLRRLLKVAAKDKTGKATEDLKNSARQYYTDLIKNRGSSTTGSLENAAASTADDMTSLAKLSKQLEKDEAVLSQIFTQDEMSVLRQTRNRLRAMTRPGRQIGANSSTKPTEGAESFLEEVASESAGRGTTISNVPGVKQARQLNTIVQFFKSAAGRSIKSGKEEQFYKDLRTEAMLNPEIAKILLKRKPPEPTKYASALKKPAMVAWMQTWDQENNQDEKPAISTKSQAPVAKSQAPSDPAQPTAPKKRFRYKNGKLVPAE